MGKLINNSFLVRSISGIVFVLLMVGCTLASSYSFVLLTCVIAIGCLIEFYRLAKQSGAEPQQFTGIAISLLSFAVILLRNYYLPESLFTIDLIGYAIVLSGVVSCAVELYRKREDPLANIASTLMGIVYVTIPMILFATLPFMQSSSLQDTNALTEGFASWRVLWVLFIIWGNDVGAYLVGVLIGRHRLMGRISPKKSWEGFFWGMLFAIGIGFIAGSYMNEGRLFWALLGGVITISGVWGDLIESMFKRSVGVKDSGSIMPGHGGFLDRFDALLFSVPFVYCYFLIF